MGISRAGLRVRPPLIVNKIVGACVPSSLKSARNGVKDEPPLLLCGLTPAADLAACPVKMAEISEEVRLRMMETAQRCQCNGKGAYQS